MAIEFVVEDGTGLSTATTYISIADMKQYWDNMEYDYSALSDDEIEALLNKASQVIDGQYFNVWPGQRSSRTQGMQWPRNDACYPDGWLIASSELPVELPDATAEMAYAKSGQSVDIQPVDANKGILTRHDVSVDVVSEGKSFQPGTYRSHPRIPAVDDIIRKLTGKTGTPGRIDLIRV